MVMKTIQQFVQNVNWGELDILLVDLPPGTGDAQLSLVQTLPARRRHHRDDPPAGGGQRRAQGRPHVPEGERAHPRRRREHELLHRPGGEEARALRRRRRHRSPPNGWARACLGRCPFSRRSGKAATSGDPDRRCRPRTAPRRGLSARSPKRCLRRLANAARRKCNNWANLPALTARGPSLSFSFTAA